MPTHNTIIRISKKLQSVRGLDELAYLLKVPAAKIMLQSLHPQYKVYSIKKKDGNQRLIEDPAPALKTTLRKLNENLQAVYYTLRPPAVHGFCISNDSEEDRNIVSNASTHIGKDWLLNIDFKDFFHTISSKRVRRIFNTRFPNFDDRLIETLTRLTCYKMRLLMGSPTSPVISNFAALPLDEELTMLCRNSGLTYTRFADDCSFSSNHEIDQEMIGLIRDTVINHRFPINEEKVKLYTPGEVKIVTGIVVENDHIALPPGYLQQVNMEIERLAATNCVEKRYETGMSMKKLKLFEQELRGKINFAQMVEGESNTIGDLYLRFETALNPPEDFESGSWLEIPYNFY